MTEQTQTLLAKSAFQDQFKGTVTDAMFREISRAYARKDDIINVDLKQGRKNAGSAAMLIIAEERLADGAACVTKVLERMSADSGVALGSVLKVSTPKWVEPQYDGITPGRPVHDSKD